jgi:hypothetical protein
VALRTVRIGELHLGVRTNTRALDLALTETLQGHLVDDRDAPANYSIFHDVADSSQTSTRFRIYIGCKHATTTRTLTRAVAIVCGYLEDHVVTKESQTETLEMLAVALVHRDEALLAPWQVRHGAPLVESRLERRGVRLLERRFVLVDPRTKELIVQPPSLPAAGVADISVAHGVVGHRVAGGRYSLRAWLVWQGWRWATATPAIATAYGMTVTRLDEDPARILSNLAKLVEDLSIRSIRTENEVLAIARDLWE